MLQGTEDRIKNTIKDQESLMKILGLFLIIVMILCTSSMPVFGELSVEDLEKIREIVNESEVRLEKRITTEIQAQEKRITDLGNRITGLGDRVTDLRERISFQGHLIIALIVAIITFVAVPMGIIVYQCNTIETATKKKKSRHSAGE